MSFSTEAKSIILDITKNNSINNIAAYTINHLNSIISNMRYTKELVLKEWDTFNNTLRHEYYDMLYKNPQIDKELIISIYDTIYYYFNEKYPGLTKLSLSTITATYNIFDSDNFVTEKVWGALIKDDILYQGPPVDTKSIISEFKSIEDTVYLLSQKSFKESGNTENNKNDVIEDKPQPSYTGNEPIKHTISAVLNTTKSLNNFGLMILKGSPCPVCGKNVKFMPSNGFCSAECTVKYFTNKLKESLTGECLSVSEKVQKIIDLVKEILLYLNLSLNVLSKLPDILTSISKLPEEYKDYAILKINIVFLELKKIINKLLIFKNKLIIKLLNRINFGTIDSKVLKILPTINAIIIFVNKLKEKLNQAIGVAYNALIKVNGFFYIGPLEYGYFITPKSAFCPCPSFKTDPLTYPESLLGKPYWGPSTINIAFDMSRCQLNIELGLKSALQNKDFKKINNIINKIFLPIQEFEYLMDPDLFDVRLALSDLNATTIQKLILTLSKTIVIGGDFIPEYNNLHLGNIWFIAAILTCWGPWTCATFGDFIFHAPVLML